MVIFQSADGTVLLLYQNKNRWTAQGSIHGLLTAKVVYNDELLSDAIIEYLIQHHPINYQHLSNSIESAFRMIRQAHVPSSELTRMLESGYLDQVFVDAKDNFDDLYVADQPINKPIFTLKDGRFVCPLPF